MFNLAGTLRQRKELRVASFAGVLLVLTWTLAALFHSRYFPRVTIRTGHKGRYNPEKVALLIENRPLPNVVPLMLHMMTVVPDDWKFQFMGSEESVAFVNATPSIQEKVAMGKLDLTYIPSNMSVKGQEAISQFLTTLWLYETVLAPAENLLIYQTDSILCANANRSLNEYLEYDWVGAPWRPDARYGGNGGLSLRKVSSIIEILRTQNRIPNNDEPEDVWLSSRLGHRPGAKNANGSVELTFSFETTRQDGLLPMGYHIGGSGKWPMGAILGTPGRRQEIYDYCPELKMVLEEMQPRQYIDGKGDCHLNWKRDADDRIEDFEGVEVLENGVVLVPFG